MPAFRFEAATPAGRIERGIVDADSAKQARGVLRERGLTPIQLVAVEDKPAAAGTVTFGGRLGDAAQSHAQALKHFGFEFWVGRPVFPDHGVFVGSGQRLSQTFVGDKHLAARGAALDPGAVLVALTRGIQAV